MAKDRKSPVTNEVRPIGARALKSVGDTLRPWLAGARVLDLYAGHGRFGIMALDEEAEAATLVEISSENAREIKRGKVVVADVFKFLDACAEKFDIVFADPPFPYWSENYEKKLLTAVHKVMADEGIFVLKAPTSMVPSLSVQGFSLWKTSPFGESKLIYLKYGH